MGLIAFLVFGVIVGFLARAIMPGRQQMGVLATMLLGIAGAFVGGLIGSAIQGLPLTDLHPGGLIGSLLGALLLLALMSYGSRRRHAVP
jgi:uncharacterized membrane protein YeaQ/YmgE (transglycosylase-associated protein family)